VGSQRGVDTMQRIGWLAVMAGLWIGGPEARAQEGPEWEMQRCVWRCLAASPGAGSPEYDRCVIDACMQYSVEGQEDPQGPAAPNGVPQGRWFAAGTGDGQGNLAGFMDPRREAAFYVICGSDGRRNLALFGPEGPAATLTLQVDGQAFARAFVPYAGGYYAALPPDAPEIAALRSGRAMAVRNAIGTALIETGLAGAAAAIAAACG